MRGIIMTIDRDLPRVSSTTMRSFDWDGCSRRHVCAGNVMGGEHGREGSLILGDVGRKKRGVRAR